MATDFRFVISDPKTRRAVQVTKEQNECQAVMGKKIKDTFSGAIVGMDGYELKITGGSDKDGFPMRPEVHGSGKKKLLITRGVGFNTEKRGLRRKKTIRGNTISDETTQINCKIVKEGSKSFEELFPTKKEEAAEESA